MTQNRRATVLLIQRGDPAAIGEAQAGGMLAARTRPLEREQAKVVEAEIDRQRIQRGLLRVAVGNDKSAEDYETMLTKARGDYQTVEAPATPVRRLFRGLLGVYGLICYIIAGAYHSQARVLGGGRP